MNCSRFTLLVLALTSFLRPVSHAELVQYTYTGAVFDAAMGSPFNPPVHQVGVDRIAGSFVIDAAVMVSLSGQNVVGDIVSFSFDDGGSGAPFPSTITDTDIIPPSNFVFHTDASGNILQWEVVLIVHSANRSMVWCNTGDGCTGSSPEIRDSVKNRAGIFSSTATSNTPGAWSSAPIIDTDGDGIGDVNDNCVLVANTSQRDTDGDGYGNFCDADLTGDCVVNAQDLGQLKLRFFSSDPDADFNGDGSVNVLDLGVLKASFFSAPGPSGVSDTCDSG